MQMTPAIVRYRMKGLTRGLDGNVGIQHRIQAKVSRPEVAEAFMSPEPERVVKKLLQEKVRIDAAGGIGTPEAASAAFMLGADFIVTGSINQCTVEAGTSESAKDLLQQINVQDTDYAPAGDMFEMGAKVQVIRKGVFFPARANKRLTIKYSAARLWARLTDGSIADGFSSPLIPAHFPAAMI